MTFPGPAALGRGVVIAAGQDVPPGFTDAPAHRIDRETLLHPSDTVAKLARHWVSRTPLVIELAVTPEELREPESSTAEPYELMSSFEFSRERLHFLVWANTYDLRSSEPIWWHGRKAMRLGAGPSDLADVSLPDGREAWCDGGPRGPLDVAQPVVHRESIELGALHTTPTSPPFAPAGLAEDQAAAVAHVAGPARVIAPAGSGKTRTLTARLSHLIRDRWIESDLVTAVAYNARAADEMRGRLGSLGAQVRTIHSLAYAIVRADRGTIEVADERRQRAILSELIPRQPQQNRDITAAYLEALAEVRIGLTPPKVVEDTRDDVPGFSELYQSYRTRLSDLSLIDFDDQIFEAIRVLLRNPELRRQVQRSCRHLLVDEFQDLTPAYILLLRLAAAPSYQVFGVGDDDQVIYGYAGADPQFLIGFDELFPGSAHFALETNYRCPTPVVDGASTLLGYNELRINKTIRAVPRTPEGTLQLLRPKMLDLAATAGDLVEHLLEGGARLPDVAILSRVNHALLPVQAVLSTRRIPHMSAVGPEFLRRTAVRAFLAYLRLGLAPDIMSRRDVEEVLGRPPRRINRVAGALLARRTRWSLSLLAEAGQQLDSGARPRFEEFIADLEAVAIATDGSTSEVVDVVRREVGLDRAAGLLDSSRSTPDRSGHTDDLDALSQLAGLYEEPATFQARLESVLTDPGDPNGVVLSTIHKVKGAEWPHVIVYGANRGSMPHQLADNIEEERRVFHVAITRGIASVAVIADAARPSRFLAELDGTAPKEPARAKRRDAPPTTGGLVPTVGDHVRWGGYEGPVVELTQDGAAIEVGGARVTVPWRERVRIGSISAPLAEPVIEPDSDLFESLRQWRSATASEQNVPAYIVLSDKHLRAVAAREPATIEELLECPGIGPTKAETYGEGILEVIDAHRQT